MEEKIMLENMKKYETTTEIVFIIGKSGSIRGLESDTIGGFNAMFRDHFLLL